MVQISISWSGQFQSFKADIIKGLIVDDHHSSAFSTNLWTDKGVLYGSKRESENFRDGTIEKAFVIMSGYHFLILEIKMFPFLLPKSG